MKDLAKERGLRIIWEDGTGGGSYDEEGVAML